MRMYKDDIWWQKEDVELSCSDDDDSGRKRQA
jgi:hypothetical protein